MEVDTKDKNLIVLGLGILLAVSLFPEEYEKKKALALPETTPEPEFIEPDLEGLKRRPGKRLMYLWQSKDEAPKVLTRSNVNKYKAKAKKGQGLLYAVFADNADQARQGIAKGKAERFLGHLGYNPKYPADYGFRKVQNEVSKRVYSLFREIYKGKPIDAKAEAIPDQMHTAIATVVNYLCEAYTESNPKHRFKQIDINKVNNKLNDKAWLMSQIRPFQRFTRVKPEPKQLTLFGYNLNMPVSKNVYDNIKRKIMSKNIRLAHAGLEKGAILSEDEIKEMQKESEIITDVIIDEYASKGFAGALWLDRKLKDPYWLQDALIDADAIINPPKDPRYNPAKTKEFLRILYKTESKTPKASMSKPALKARISVPEPEQLKLFGLSGQLLTCAAWQSVFSEKRGKEIRRCFVYEPSCNPPGTCRSEPAEVPAFMREPPELKPVPKDLIDAVAEEIAEEKNIDMNEKLDFFRRVMQQGFLETKTKGGETFEEHAELPKQFIRHGRGLRPDELAQALNMNEDELLRMLRDYKINPPREGLQKYEKKWSPKMERVKMWAEQRIKNYPQQYGEWAGLGGLRRRAL